MSAGFVDGYDCYRYSSLRICLLGYCKWSQSHAQICIGDCCLWYYAALHGYLSSVVPLLWLDWLEFRDLCWNVGRPGKQGVNTHTTIHLTALWSCIWHRAHSLVYTDKFNGSTSHTLTPCIFEQQRTQRLTLFISIIYMMSYRLIATEQLRRAIDSRANT